MVASWYNHLDQMKADLDSLITAGRFPPCHIEVTPAAPELGDLKRMHRKTRTQVFLSLAGGDDENEANSPGAGLLVVAHVYTRDGAAADHGAKIERNRLAAIVCEQLHVVLRDIHQYQFEDPDRVWALGRGSGISWRNFSYRGSASNTPDEHSLAHWVMTWTAATQSEAMGQGELSDLTSLHYELDGAELGGDNPDIGDNENTSVEFP